MKYIVIKAVKGRIQELGKQATKNYLLALDAAVEQTIEASCRTFNGGRKRLDENILTLSKKGLR